MGQRERTLLAFLKDLAPVGNCSPRGSDALTQTYKQADTNVHEINPKKKCLKKKIVLKSFFKNTVLKTYL